MGLSNLDYGNRSIHRFKSIDPPQAYNTGCLCQFSLLPASDQHIWSLKYDEHYFCHRLPDLASNNDISNIFCGDQDLL